MANINCLGRQEFAQTYANMPVSGHIKAKEQHAQFVKLGYTVGAEGAHARALTLQVQDYKGTSVAETFRVRIKSNLVAVSMADGGAGSLIETITAGVEYVFDTDTNGALVVNLTHTAGAETFILFCELMAAVPELNWGNMLTFTMD